MMSSSIEDAKQACNSDETIIASKLDDQSLSAFIEFMKSKKIRYIKSRFYVSRFYVKSRIYVVKSDDKIQSLLNIVSQFYVISRFYVAFAADQQDRKMEI